MRKIIYLLMVLVSVNSYSQDNFWAERDIKNIPQEDMINYETQVSKFSVYQLDEVLLQSALQNAPLRSQSTSSNVLLNFPYGENKFGIFEMFEVQTLAPELAANYPSIKSYVGQARGQNPDRIRLTITPTGIYAKIFSTNGSVYINPLTKTGSFYKVFNLLDATFSAMVCDFEDDLEGKVFSDENNSEANLVDDSTFRTFRLAVATTAEYSLFHINEAGLNSAPDAQKKAVVLAAIIVSVDRVNGILENDLSVNLQIIPTNDNLIFLDPATDPYTNFFPNINTGTYLQENNAFMPGTVGDNNYDIGHVLTTRGGGIAIRGSVCNDNVKAAGVSGSSNPVGDGIDLTFAHEIGHQLGASHTYNNPCDGNRSDNSVYEVGSGVTIMSYAGICGPNVQGRSFDYYHAASLLQIFNLIDNIPCAQTTSISNSPPTVASQPNYVIPRRTPFVLEANATDPDNDVLTYIWEQFDNQISPQPPTPSATNGPLFRNFEPITSNLRYFPRIETLLNNQLQTIWEVLPNASRNMNYVVTVRDNNILGGQNVQDLVSIDVEAAAGPFKVTSQNTPNITWIPGDVVTINWDVAGTDANGINASEVDFILSTDGGFTYDEILLQNTPNDGTQDITVPFGIIGENCRLMVKASDNIFFALNEEFFNVNATCFTQDNLNTVNIPDGAGFFDPIAGPPAESVITVTDDDTVQSVVVSVELTHSRLTDIDVELESPDGQIVQLWSKDLCDSGGLDITFQDGRADLPTDNCGSSVQGSFQPVESLSAFQNGNTDGNWTLRVTDFLFAETGTIQSWSIEICSALVLDSEVFSKELFALYPNPADNYVKLIFNQATSKNTSIHLFDVNGRLVKTQSAKNSITSQDIDVSNLSRGVYFVRVNQDNSETVKKLIVK